MRYILENFANGFDGLSKVAYLYELEKLYYELGNTNKTIEKINKSITN